MSVSLEILQKKLREYIELEKSLPFLEEAKQLKENPSEKELIERFREDLKFGTGGMRGLIGAGSSYMNPYNVRRATQALCNYIKDFKGKKENKRALKAVLSFDSRHYSWDFAQACALVFAGNGFKTYLFRESRPTPFLSFAIRYLQADTGIMLTASHNPPTYNGYKAYWHTGGQLTPPHDENVVKAFGLVKNIKELSESEALKKGLLIYLESELDDIFLQKLNETLPSLTEEIKNQELKLVYTPLHGIGGLLVDKLFQDLPKLQLYTVKEQIEPDGNFPSLQFPNPEEPSAYALALKLAREVEADLIIANDPDADRMGCQTKNKQGDWVFVSGNQIGCLFLDYLLRHDKKASKAYLTNSIVTTDLQEKIAKHYGARTFKTLTGFKWMALEVDRLLQEKPELHLSLATEESYGFFCGDYTREKDALLASKLLTEIVLWLKQKKLTLLEYLEDIWKRIGFYQDTLLSKTFEGLDSQEQRERIMKRMRENPPTKIGSFRVKDKKDYSLLTHTNAQSECKTIEAKFRTDALEFILEEKAKFSLRPSGTEPKIKMYLSAWGDLKEKQEVLERLEKLKNDLEVFLQ